MSHPAPYALRFCVPTYDNRDAIVGHRYYVDDMRYGTIAGVLVALRLYQRDNDGNEIYAEAWDVSERRRVTDDEVLRARADAHGWNLLASRVAFDNDKDSIPF